jgi:hypothetical protein
VAVRRPAARCAPLGGRLPERAASQSIRFTTASLVVEPAAAAPAAEQPKTLQLPDAGGDEEPHPRARPLKRGAAAGSEQIRRDTHTHVFFPACGAFSAPARRRSALSLRPPAPPSAPNAGRLGPSGRTPRRLPSAHAHPATAAAAGHRAGRAAAQKKGREPGALAPRPCAVSPPPLLPWRLPCRAAVGSPPRAPPAFPLAAAARWQSAHAPPLSPPSSLLLTRARRATAGGRSSSPALFRDAQQRRVSAQASRRRGGTHRACAAAAA